MILFFLKLVIFYDFLVTSIMETNKKVTIKVPTGDPRQFGKKNKICNHNINI